MHANRVKTQAGCHTGSLPGSTGWDGIRVCCLAAACCKSKPNGADAANLRQGLPVGEILMRQRTQPRWHRVGRPCVVAHNTLVADCSQEETNEAQDREASDLCAFRSGCTRDEVSEVLTVEVE
jgi:hypothetical protein